MVEEQAKDDKVTEETVSDEKPAEEIKENGSTADEEKPTENGDDAKEKSSEGTKTKKKAKKTEKEDKDKNKDNDDDEDGESSEEELGSLEKPVEILTKKRERKSVEVYTVEKVKEEEKKEGLDYSKGKGVKLGDIPIVNHNVSRADTEDLQVLHRMMYRKPGKLHNTKKNIREFCGWPFEKDSKEYNSVKYNLIDRLLTTALKWTLNLLGLDKSGKDTEQQRDLLLEFLLKPEMNDMEIPTRRKSGGSKRKSSGKKRTPKGKGKSKSKPKKKSEGSDDEDEVSDVSDASDDNDSGSDEEEEKEEKPKKKTPAKKPTPKKKATPVKIAIPAKKSKSASKKRKPAASDESSEDEAPLVKKSNVPPTDAELKKVVSAILKDADLEEVTMKSVVRQVYDKYSSFDLSSRKDFIKGTVKELIS